MGLKIEKRVYGNNEKEFIEDIYFYWGLVGSGTIDTEELIEHERGHFQRATELGYSPKYGYTRTSINIGPLNFKREGARVYIENPSPNDLKEICLAPENPSFLDKFFASKMFQFFYSFFYNYRRLSA